MVLNAESADKIVVVARTSGSQVDEEGISLFVVDADPNIYPGAPEYQEDDLDSNCDNEDNPEANPDQRAKQENKDMERNQ